MLSCEYLAYLTIVLYCICALLLIFVRVYFIFPSFVLIKVYKTFLKHSLQYFIFNVIFSERRVNVLIPLRNFIHPGILTEHSGIQNCPNSMSLT